MSLFRFLQNKVEGDEPYVFKYVEVRLTREPIPGARVLWGYETKKIGR